MKKHPVILRTILVFISVFVLNYFVFDKIDTSTLIEAVIIFAAIFFVLYVTKTDSE